MTGKFKRLIIPAVILIGLAVPLAAPAIVSADIQGSLCGSAQDLSVSSTKDCTTTGGSESRFNKILTDVINIFSIVVGVVAVIMIIFGGFKYITSAGNQENIKTAKTTIIYAIIGIVIVALAQIIVKFVLNQTTNPGSNSGVCTKSPYNPDYYYWVGGLKDGEQCTP